MSEDNSNPRYEDSKDEKRVEKLEYLVSEKEPDYVRGQQDFKPTPRTVEIITTNSSDLIGFQKLPKRTYRQNEAEDKAGGSSLILEV